MKKADYKLVMKPSDIEFECPYCSTEISLSFSDVLDKSGDEYDLWVGNVGVSVECDFCKKDIELADVDID
ncbi:hypothetical protein RyT2_24960 [Pseudolactococcus yaeyamensis]